jgi:hypothetical protein
MARPRRIHFCGSETGFAGFFQFFTATFDGDREHVELTVNALYPET